MKSIFTLFLVAVLTTACGQTSKNEQTDKKETEKITASVPKTDLQTAVISGDLEVVRQHIAAGSDLNEKEPFNGSSPLITAATFGKTQIAQELVDAGADLTIKNNDGTTALHSAAFFCRVEIVQLLMDAKADKTILNNYGATPAQIVSGPFEDVKPIYEMMQQQLKPFGLELDLAEVEKTRPVIAMMLQ